MLQSAHLKIPDCAFVSLETVSLADAAHREVQRRTEASVDHAAGLPPDVVAVLTMFDALERQKEEAHNTAHKRFADSINRFFDKLQTEETKYNNRMEELQVGKANYVLLLKVNIYKVNLIHALLALKLDSPQTKMCFMSFLHPLKEGKKLLSKDTEVK